MGKQSRMKYLFFLRRCLTSGGPHALILLIVLVLAWPVLSWDTSQLTTRVPDDAFYYLNVARNIALGYGSSFDRINATNGYHPLWMLLIIPVYKLVADVDLALRTVLLVQTVLLVVSFELVYWSLRPHVGAWAVLVVLPVVLYSRFTNLLTGGLESPLVVAVLAAALALLIPLLKKEAACHRAGVVALGIVLGLLVLARLDYVVFTVSAVALIAARIGIRRQLGLRAAKITLIAFLPTIFFVLPYLTWNYLGFGRVTTISGALKSSFPHLQPRLGIWNTLYPEYLLDFCTLKTEPLKCPAKFKITRPGRR